MKLINKIGRGLISKTALTIYGIVTLWQAANIYYDKEINPEIPPQEPVKLEILHQVDSLDTYINQIIEQSYASQLSQEEAQTILNTTAERDNLKKIRTYQVQKEQYDSQMVEHNKKMESYASGEILEDWLNRGKFTLSLAFLIFSKIGRTIYSTED